MLRKLSSVGITTVLILLGAPMAAHAATDYYVDVDTGSNANACTATASPCATIQAAIGKAEGSSPFSDDVVHVDQSDTYNENVSSNQNTDLISEQFQNDPIEGGGTTINGGAGQAISGATIGDVNGFVLDGDSGGLVVGEADEIRGNTILGSASGGGLLVQAPVGTVIADNDFVGILAGSNASAIRVGPGTSDVNSNRINKFHVGIEATDLGVGLEATPAITDNFIRGTFGNSPTDPGIGIKGGEDTDLTLVANGIEQPGAGDTIGVSVDGDDSDANTELDTGLHMSRNSIFNQTLGVNVRDTDLGSTMFSDVIAGGQIGVSILNEDGLGSDGDTTLTNVTIWNTSLTDATASDAILTLDSSIVQDPILAPAGVCNISFSRGPTMDSSGNGCADFQTTADPMFESLTVFNLAQGSPLIDAGNPAAPPPGPDRSGGDRVLVGTPACALRRDIGADEFFLTPPPDCTDPVTSAGTPSVGKAKVKKKSKKNGKKKKKGKPPTGLVKFSFSSNEAGSTFQCKVDGAAYAACKSPASYRLKLGSHSFSVRAIDAAGRVDATPVTQTVKVVKKKAKKKKRKK